MLALFKSEREADESSRKEGDDEKGEVVRSTNGCRSDEFETGGTQERRSLLVFGFGVVRRNYEGE
jgi:hypothetical protein